MLRPNGHPADPWADAERSARDLLYYREDFTKLNKTAVREIVTAIANAEEAERKELRNAPRATLGTK